MGQLFNIPTLYRREQDGALEAGCRKGDGPLNFLGEGSEGWLLGDLTMTWELAVYISRNYFMIAERRSRSLDGGDFVEVGIGEV